MQQLFTINAHNYMKKAEAIELFNANITAMSKAVGVSRYTIHRWKDELTQSQRNMVIGARAQLDADQRAKLDEVLVK